MANSRKRKSSHKTTKNTQQKTNKIFRDNLNTFKFDGRRLGVLALFDMGNSIVPFRVVIPYDNIVTEPDDTEDEIKSNVGMLFYGFNYYDEIKHTINISHTGFTEALSYGVGALAKFMYENNPDKSFGDDDFGVVMSFNFKKLPNTNYEISSSSDTMYVEFDNWVNFSDNVKLHLSENYVKKNKVVENQVLIG